MAKVTAGIFPVHNNEFKLGLKGVDSVEEADFAMPKGLENFAPSFDNGVEEYYPMENEGWVERLLTAKSWGLSFTGKRHVGDPANDYIADMLFAIGQDANTILKWTMPNGTTIEQKMVVSVTNVGGGDSTNIGALEFELQSSGKPTVTKAA